MNKYFFSKVNSDYHQAMVNLNGRFRFVSQYSGIQHYRPQVICVGWMFVACCPGRITPNRMFFFSWLAPKQTNENTFDPAGVLDLWMLQLFIVNVFIYSWIFFPIKDFLPTNFFRIYLLLPITWKESSGREWKNEH